VSQPCHGAVAATDDAADMRRISLLGMVFLLGACATSTTHADRPSTTAPRRASTTTTAPPGSEVTFTVAGPAISLQTPGCAAGCPLPYNQTGRVTGSLVGTVTGAGAVVLDGARYGGASTFVFRGTIAGCGSGTVVLRRREDGSLTAHTVGGSWDIAPGWGSNDLRDVSGIGTIAAPAADPGAGRIASTFHGRVVCHTNASTTPAAPQLANSVPVRFTSTTPTPSVAAPACARPNVCVYPTFQRSTYAGSLRGTERAAGAGFVRTTARGFAYAATSVAIVDVDVDSCGKGTMAIRAFSEFDGRSVAASWDVVPGSGTGALKTTHGAGTSSGTQSLDGTYHTTLRGALVCR
jgi:hypothetical protein